MDIYNLQKMSKEEAREFFRKEGLELTEEQVELVTEFLYNLTTWVMRELFDNE